MQTPKVPIYDFKKGASGYVPRTSQTSIYLSFIEEKKGFMVAKKKSLRTSRLSGITL